MCRVNFMYFIWNSWVHVSVKSVYMELTVSFRNSSLSQCIYIVHSVPDWHLTLRVFMRVELFRNVFQTQPFFIFK